jgi:tyrosine-protein phosphatase SIW14
MFRLFGRSHILILSLLLVFSLHAQDTTPPIAAHSSDPPVRSLAQKRKIKGVPNFGEVTPLLLRGAQPSSDGFQTLAKMGVDIVVNARSGRIDTEGTQVRQLGMEYVAIPWHCGSPHDDVFVKFLSLLKDHPDKKVFLHCQLGEDRTGMMIAAYRMAFEGWTADEAMREMRHFGFSSFHHVMCPGLASYEKEFPKHMKSNPAFQGLRPSYESSSH